jgi:hypothetical protein
MFAVPQLPTLVSLGAMFWSGVLLAGVCFVASRTALRPAWASILVGVALFSLVAAGLMGAGWITLSTG